MLAKSLRLHPPDGHLLADKNLSWWEKQELSALTNFQVEHDLEIIHYRKNRKPRSIRNWQLSNTEPWASNIVFLMQIPGFGLLFSMITLSAIGDISRFDSPKKLVGYADLGAGVHDSGKKHQDKSITKEGRKELRWALLEAAWGAMRSDPYWKNQYERLTKIKHPSKAIVAIAHRLLVSVWHILTKRQP